MAPIVEGVRREKHAHAVLEAFAEQLEDNLRSKTLSSRLLDDLRREIDRVTTLHHAAAASKKVDLDKQGTRLWNLASSSKSKPDDGELMCSVRVFACLLIDCAQRCSPVQVVSNDFRVLKTSLRSLKVCLGQHQLNLAKIIAERAAFFEERLKGADDGKSSEHRHLISVLSNDYLTLRIALAWRQDRLDLAQLMLAKVPVGPGALERRTAEELADTMFEIGRTQSQKLCWWGASFWYERAYDIALDYALAVFSSDAEELHFAIMHGLARALINQESEESRAKAWDLIHKLDVECGERLIVPLLKLDLLTVDPAHSPQDYCDVLQRIASTVHLTDKNIKTILHHVHKLRARSPPMAQTILVTLFTERLLDAEQTQWLEKVLMTIIWNCTTSAGILDALNSLRELLDTLASRSDRGLMPSATHAAQILLWKHIETSYNQGQLEAAEAWCHLSLHPVFSRSGDLNVGKLQRKLILCALGMSDAAKAREIYSQMSASNRSDSPTQYLLYKVALRSRDIELAIECLDAICVASTKDATLLYACVLEAQQTGDQTQMVISLQRVLAKYDYSAPNGVYLPALLRCAARLLIREIDNPQSYTKDGVDNICKLFEGAAVQAKRSKLDPTNDMFSLAELDWFSRNSYNLVLTVCTNWPPERTLRLVQVCIKFIELYPVTTDAGVKVDLSLRRIFCNFLCASLLIVLARHEDNVAGQLQHYLSIRKVVDDFRKFVDDQVSRLEGGAREDLERKHASLLAYDFEAAARLKAWGSFRQIIEELEAHGHSKSYGILADIVLSSEAPNDVIITTLQHIVNATWQRESHNIGNLSRWIRCLFTLALASNAETAEQLLEQVMSIVEEARKQTIDYPPEELEWLSTTTFNRAIDFYCSSQDAKCRQWAEKALALSSLCRDGGGLHEILQQKYQKLAWRS